MGKRAPAPAGCLHEARLDLAPAADEPGAVRVSWRVEDGHGPDVLVFEWREEGVRLVNSSPQRVGFGRELTTRGLPYELGARTEPAFGQGGVRRRICTLLELDGGPP